MGHGRRFPGRPRRAARRDEVTGRGSRQPPRQRRCRFMAAWAAMRLKTRDRCGPPYCSPPCWSWSPVAAAWSTGRAVIAVPRPGTPVAVGALRGRAVRATPRMPSGAECGMLSVPVDLRQARRRRRPARDDPVQGHRRQDRLAGHQPRRPGRVGCGGGGSLVGAMPHVGARALRPGRLRPARGRRVDAGGVVQLRRRQRPAARRPEVDYTPEGVAHIEAETKEFVQRCVDKMGKEFLANVGTAKRGQGSRRHARRARRREADLPRLLLRHPHRRGLRRGVSADTCAR